MSQAFLFDRPVAPPAIAVASRPFLKWCGGKAQLLEQLDPLLPTSFGDYHEPFVGGGALFHHRRPRVAFLSDVNPRLMKAYRAIRDNVDGVIRELRLRKYDVAEFYAIRSRFNKELDAPDHVVAAWFIYLNKTCINGLYRENKSGGFNASFGTYTNPKICDEPNLRACAAALAGVSLNTCDFRVSLAGLKRGDFAFVDPPYVPLTATANFTGYQGGGFSWQDHLDLLEMLSMLDRRGVLWMLCNSDAPASDDGRHSTRDLYSAFDVQTVQAKRSINSNAKKRGPVSELVVRNLARWAPDA